MAHPTYTALIPATIAWAAQRGLLHPDGTANKATPEAQHRKTLEEIGEASLELRKLAKTRAVVARLRIIGQGNEDTAILARRRQRLALEFGDVLVTLGLQSALQGVAWDECLAAACRYGTGWGSLWRMNQPSDPPCTWQFVDYHALLLDMAVGHGHRGDTCLYIGNLARCVEDEARIQLSMTGPECLALALAKISGRRGEVVNGEFVKAAPEAVGL